MGMGSYSPRHDTAPSTISRALHIQHKRAPSPNPTKVMAGRRCMMEQSDGWQSNRSQLWMYADLRGTSAVRSQTSKHPENKKKKKQ